MTDNAGSANYPLNCWYVIATSDEVGRSLLAREALGRRLLLFRTEDGQAAVLDDRCPHRAAPLSMGALDGDRVVCAYHGFTYAPDGQCVRVPSQRHVPYGARVRSYPVIERPPFVWIWPGNPARSRGTEPPDLPPLREPGWTVLGGSLEMAVNYLLLHDNALDRTHFPYVHPHRIHRGYVQDPPPLRIEVAETTVSYSRTFTPAPLIGWQHDATGLPADQEYTQRETGTFVSPALHVDEMDIIGPDQDYRGVFIRAFTPVDAGRTLIIWRGARNYAHGDESVTDRLREVYEGTMAEDQPLLAAIQAATGGAIGYQVSAAADAAAIRAYQIVEALLAEEKGWAYPRRRD
jgi:vanillate O-demethylase monooxygenase subunit